MQQRPALQSPPSALFHASSLGAAILPLPHARPSAGVNSGFQHKTKMAAASVDARMKIYSTPPCLAPPPGTVSQAAKGTQTQKMAFN